MAYVPRDLSVLAYANGFTLWHYATGDTAVAVGTNGYFNESAHMIRIGDIIFANTDTDGSPGAGIFLVRENVNGQIDVANMTAIGTADTA